MILVGGFVLLVVLRVPVAFALGIATIPVVALDIRLQPFLILNGMFTSYNSFILLAVPFFLLAANLMNSGKITDRLIELARVLTGWMPGGLGQVNVAVSMLFAGISGSSTADAAGCGKILIPAMVKKGYDPRFAVAITACSSVMGVIIPPSILMVVWGGVMSLSVGALFLAGAIPGLLIAVALMATVYGYAKVYDYPVAGRPNAAEFWAALKGAGLAMLTPVFVIGGIVGGIVTPTESAIIAAFYSFILGFFVYRTVSATTRNRMLNETGRFYFRSRYFRHRYGIRVRWMLIFLRTCPLIVGLVTDLEFGNTGTCPHDCKRCSYSFGLFIERAIPGRSSILGNSWLLDVAERG
ncbi:UNVERIFIED_CONTAM: hypothetical protein GTU68_034645 [Idotea baltica]|nr:hypothetical protein [Idotea baltica]